MKPDARPRQSGRVVVAGTATAAALTALLQAHGAILTPDGWAYWQGSVSLLQGHGYRYFTGEPITMWPPTMSVVLAAFQGIFGISGVVISTSLVVITAAGALVWSVALDGMWRDAGISPALRATGTIVLGAGLACWSRALMAHPLAVLVLGAVVLLIERGRTRSLAAMFGATLLAASLPTVHASMVVVFPGLWLWAAGRADRNGRRGLWRAAWIPAAGCLGVASLWLFGTLRSHVGAGTASPTPLSENTVHALQGVRELLVPAAHGLGLAVLVVLVALAAMVARDDPRWRAPLIVVASSIAGLVALFSVTWVNDPLSGRFLLFLWPLLVGVLVGGTAVGQRPVRWACTVVFIVVGAVQGARVTVWARSPGDLSYPVRASWGTTIDTAFVTGAAEQRGNRLVVAPPVYPWQRR